MAKSKRGKGIKTTANWRGTCPLCQRTGVKLLWAKTGNDKQTLKVCKRCGD